MIGGITQYIMMFSVIISYWSTRDTARKIDSGKTAVIGTMFLSIFTVIVYLIISYFLGTETKTDLNILYFSSILIPVMFFGGILTAINLGWKPHTISYGLLAFGITQMLFGLFFVYFLNMEVIGVILASLLAHSINAVILFKYARFKLRNKLDFSYFKRWMKLSWLPLYPWIPVVVGGLEISIFAIMTGSVIGLAIWTAAMAVSSIINQVGLISRAVYPKLLENNTTYYIRDNISLLFFFNFMMAGAIIVFAKPALFALNPIYVDAFPVVIILAIMYFFTVLSNMSVQNLTGVENVDLDKNATMKRYIQSKLFYPHTLRLVQTVISTSSLIVGFYLLINSDSSNMELLTFWSLVLLFTQLPISLILLNKMKKAIEIKLDYTKILKYFIISICAFFSIHLITENYLIYESNVFTFLPSLLSFFGLGLLFYVSLAYATDQKTRQLITSIMKEIKSKGK
ncbi:hypothetical protein [Nitrosopumilus sp. b2]|uniref:hypothetical protein n=1 Tax=Nitrosopumilus sp. b2 TaxID=2109908 RepID=UPI0015F6EAE8|nr:hypothetical protein [Nitrosopumilus sp. b2]